MKKVVFVLITLIAFNAQAQKGPHHKKSDLTPEQMATTRTKQMTLALDLSEAQQSDVLDLNVKNAEKFSKSKGERKELTEEERYEMKNKMLDAQIANQRAMRKILNDDQYPQWRKMQRSKMHKMSDARKHKMKREHAPQKREH